MLSLALMSFTYMAELMAPDLATKLTWNDLEYVGFCIMVPTYLVFILFYIGRKDLMTRRNMAILYAFPTLIFFLVATNQYHHLYYTSVSLVQVGDLQSFQAVAGPFYVLWSIYVVSALVVGFFLLLNAYRTTREATRRQVGLVCVAVSLPFIAFVLHLAGILELELTYALILAFSGTGVLCFIAIIKYNLLGIMPLAIGQVVNSMKFGVLVINEENTLYYANPAAFALLGEGLGNLIGLPAADLATLVPLEEIQRVGEAGVEMCSIGETKRTLRLRLSPLRNSADVITGQLLIVDDITAEREMTDALRLANEKMDLMSRVTRHDIMNRLMVIEASASMLQSGRTVDVAKNAQRIADSAKAIRYQVDFASEYQKMGIKKPSWKDVRRTFAMAKSMSTASLTPSEVVVEGIEVLADDMLERVFYILLDNSFRHGQIMTSVRLRYEVREGSLILIYEDNGVGVPSGEKTAIFESGYGQNTGLGLHLARQILAITDITIAESGEPGKGAHFEMLVPAGRWRSHARPDDHLADASSRS
jgi:signal transduction histidine kinase